MKFLFFLPLSLLYTNKKSHNILRLFYNYNYLTTTSLLTLLCTTFLLLGLLNDRLFSFLELFLESLLELFLESRILNFDLFDDFDLFFEPLWYFSIFIYTFYLRLFDYFSLYWCTKRFSISSKCFSSFAATNVIARPDPPARPVRPMR